VQTTIHTQLNQKRNVHRLFTVQNKTEKKIGYPHEQSVLAKTVFFVI